MIKRDTMNALQGTLKHFFEAPLKKHSDTFGRPDAGDPNKSFAKHDSVDLITFQEPYYLPVPVRVKLRSAKFTYSSSGLLDPCITPQFTLAAIFNSLHIVTHTHHQVRHTDDGDEEEKLAIASNPTHRDPF